MPNLVGKQSDGEQDLAYPAPPVDSHPPLPIPRNPPAPLYMAIVVAALSLVAYLAGYLEWGAVGLIVAQGFLALYLQRAMPYPGPVVNPPPPPPPPYQMARTLVSVAIVAFGVGVLAFGLQSRAGFIGGALVGIALTLGALMPGGATAGARA